MSTLAERLRIARKKAGMTQEGLAKAAGVTREAIAQIETGRTLRTRDIMDLAKALDVSPAWLQFGAEAIDGLSEAALAAALDLDGLDEDGKQLVLDMIRTLKNRQD